MIEFNRGVCSCSVELVALFKFLVNWTCGSSQVIIGETRSIKVDCELRSYVQMDKTFTDTSDWFALCWIIYKLLRLDVVFLPGVTISEMAERGLIKDAH